MKRSGPNPFTPHNSARTELFRLPHPYYIDTGRAHLRNQTRNTRDVGNVRRAKKVDAVYHQGTGNGIAETQCT